jgi:MinD superfamily P-loop ATPase
MEQAQRDKAPKAKEWGHAAAGKAEAWEEEDARAEDAECVVRGADWEDSTLLPLCLQTLNLSCLPFRKAIHESKAIRLPCVHAGSQMKIAIASGKGGTGKTMVATGLAWTASQMGKSVTYADCDVEAPNGHLFLHPTLTCERIVSSLLPQVDALRCVGCGKCVRFCQFHAITRIARTITIFPELCHSCGGCRLLCPNDAIIEVPRRIGATQQGHAGKISFIQGLLNVGESQSPPVIREVKQLLIPSDLILLDSPPGTSCPVVETVRGCDLVLLITDSTLFGLHDLQLAFEMTRILHLPCAVVINRAGPSRSLTREFCIKENIPILAEIPDSWLVAKAYSRGELAAETVPQLKPIFLELLLRLLKFAETIHQKPFRPQPCLK